MILQHDERYDAALLTAGAMQLADSHDQLLKELVALRKVHGLSQAAVAERMSVSQPTVAAFERYDANPTLSTIRRYALAVHASIEHVVADSCRGASGWVETAVAAKRVRQGMESAVRGGHGSWVK